MRYLLTPSLLSSWRWYLDHAEDQRTQEEIRKTFARMKVPPSKAAQAGIDFERDVYVYLHDKFSGDVDDEYRACVREVVEEIRGGSYQVKAQRELIFPGRTFLCYGRIDALKADTIYDIKFTGSPYEIGKYQDSPQHRLYFYIIPDVPRFVYLTSDGEHVWQESYNREDCQDIRADAADFDNWLTVFPELRELYNDNWQAYG